MPNVCIPELVEILNVCCLAKREYVRVRPVRAFVIRYVVGESGTAKMLLSVDGDGDGEKLEILSCSNWHLSD